MSAIDRVLDRRSEDRMDSWMIRPAASTPIEQAYDASADDAEPETEARPSASPASAETAREPSREAQRRVGARPLSAEVQPRGAGEPRKDPESGLTSGPWWAVRARARDAEEEEARPEADRGSSAGASVKQR